MLVRLSAVSLVLAGAVSFSALADEPLCKPGHVLDPSRQLCYDPSTAYKPNVPAQQPVLGPIFGGSSAARTPSSSDAAKPASAASSSSGGGFFGWLGDQARFCRYGDRQVGSGDSAYCMTRDGKTYPAGR